MTERTFIVYRKQFLLLPPLKHNAGFVQPTQPIIGSKFKEYKGKSRFSHLRSQLICCLIIQPIIYVDINYLMLSSLIHNKFLCVHKSYFWK